jgi:hypothetical protein
MEMPGPFPGVDPYIEAQGFWPDFHASFITYLRDVLAENLPSNYEARIDERVNLVELPAEKLKRIKPDLAVSRGELSGLGSVSTGVATLEPVTIPLVIEEESRETYLEILHRPNRMLVTVIELLSPSNKEDPGRALYLAKRNSLLHQPVHMVELDLLTRGQRVPLSKDYPAGHFFALVARANRRPDCQVYAWTMQQPLPSIPIPLFLPDPDLWISLEAVFSLTYQRGRYAGSLDYAGPVPDWIDAEGRRWIQATLEHAGK